MPLASADAAGVVIYVGTFSKILAPGLRLGFTVAPAPAAGAARRACARSSIARATPATESAVAELIEDGELQRHARRMRRIYQARRDAFVAALRRRLGDALTFRVPPGGMSLWARAAAASTSTAWCQLGAARGVGFVPGSAYVLPGGRAGAGALGKSSASRVRSVRAAQAGRGGVAPGSCLTRTSYPGTLGGLALHSAPHATHLPRASRGLAGPSCAGRRDRQRSSRKLAPARDRARMCAARSP